MLASNGLITAPCGEPCTGVQLSVPFRISAFSHPRIRSSTRPSLTLASTRAINASCGIESKYPAKSASTTWVYPSLISRSTSRVVLKARAFGTTHHGTRVLCAKAQKKDGTEAIAPLREPVLEDRFDDEPDRLLDDTILDRRHSHVGLH